MNKEVARQVAARIWCEPEMSWMAMNANLADKIADLLLDEWIVQANTMIQEAIYRRNDGWYRDPPM